MRCKFRGKCVIFSFVFLRGLFMRLRARGNGKGLVNHFNKRTILLNDGQVIGDGLGSYEV